MKIVRAHSRKYKNGRQYLGIVEDNGRFITGQEKSKDNPDGLTQEEMKNPDLIPAEKRKKYPRVITPDTYLAIHDGQKLDPEGEDSETDAIWGLIKLQPNIALTKEKLNPSIHDWYIEDPRNDEAVKQKRRRIKNKATTYVDKVSTAELTTFLIYASNELNRITSPPQNMNPDRIYNVSYDIAEEYPQETVKFFENKDESMKKKIAVLELITYNIVTKQNNQFFDGPTYLGSNIKELTDFIEDPKHAATKDKFFKQLHKAKTGSEDYSLTKEEVESTEASQLIKNAKVKYADNEVEKAAELLNQAKQLKMNSETKKDYDAIFKKVFDSSSQNVSDDLKTSFDKKGSENFDSTSNLEDKDIEEIRSLLRSKKIKGWTKNMSKQELINLLNG